MEMVFKLVGGIGLFLMGMVMLTDGLKAFAGDNLRQALLRFTGQPINSLAAGCSVTLLIQSSSATTVAVIGFVSAGLLTFSQAIGVVMGASLGTTGTGWIVSVLGLKISVGFYALPLVGVGAFIHLLAARSVKPLGTALAGFGLIFIGIETLQQGMGQFSSTINFTSVPSSGLFGHFLLMIIGILMTIIMQSSSAAIATTLTALHANSISFEQAASLVIGAAIGTTVTGALAAMGGSVSAKRTAAAHVVFNLATGLIALVLLPLFLWGIEWAQQNAGLQAGAMSLAAFHTSFVFIGILLFFPFIEQFAALIERLIPDPNPQITRHLDPSILNVPAVALETTRRALQEITLQSIQEFKQQLSSSHNTPKPESTMSLEQSLDAITEFLTKIPAVNGESSISHVRENQIHAIEHLTRLISRLNNMHSLGKTIQTPRIQPSLNATVTLLQHAAESLRVNKPTLMIQTLQEHSLGLREKRNQERPIILHEIAEGTINPDVALEYLDAVRWLDTVGYHAWRICFYLQNNGEAEVHTSGAAALVN